MEPEDRIVRYDKWCEKCIHEKLEEAEYPCDICLANPWNENTSKPIMYKAKEEK